MCRRVHAVKPERWSSIAESEHATIRRSSPSRDATPSGPTTSTTRCASLLTGDREGYYAEFGTLAAMAKVFHRPTTTTAPTRASAAAFGAPAADVRSEHFVVFASNHDQVGNRALGDRLPVAARPLAAFCTLLAPFTPMLFQGEEHGDTAPFQFFSDHIDEEIATATREGRRREFSAFAEFAGEEVPDPQDEATFTASTLTRDGEPEGLRDLYAALLRARAELPPGDAHDIAFDEHQGWLRAARGPYTLLMNFSARDVHVPVEGTLSTVLSTHHATLEPGYVVLPPQSGALLK